MAGSVPGPTPKRDAERNRTNVPANGHAKQYASDQFKDLDFDVETLVEPPPPNEKWHDVARMQYEALLRDPARVWMGPADWALSYLMCENISRQLSPVVIGIVEGGYDPETGEQVAGHVAKDVVPLKGTDISGILKWYTGLGVTEAARMALRKEVTFNEKQKPEAVQGGQVVSIRPEGHFSTGQPA